jgi:hypothetical protein
MHLYLQTNETRNAIIHYRWDASGKLTEVERVATSGAGSGQFTHCIWEGLRGASRSTFPDCL